MSSALANPDSSIRTADRTKGTSSALTTKPARSGLSTTCLPSRSSTKVRARDLLGTLRGAAETRDRDRGGVGGEQRVGGGHGPVEAAEHLGLDPLVLHDRLDHELAVGERVEVGGHGDAVE